MYVIILCTCHTFIEFSIYGSNSEHSILAFHKENTVSKQIMPMDIANIYVSIFGKSLQFFYLVYIWMIWPTLYVRFSNIIFNNNMIKIANIYVSTTGYLLQQINMSWCRKNSQHYISDHTNLKKIQLIIENEKYF